MKTLYRLAAGNARYASSVRWNFDGRHHRKYFANPSRAKAWAEARNLEAKNSGVGVLQMTDELRVEALSAKALIAKFGKSLTDAAALAAGIWQAQEDSVAVNVAVASLMASRTGHSARYRRDLGERIAGFAAVFGERPISSIAGKEIREWLAALPVGAVSRNNVRRNLSVLFGHAVEMEWLKENTMLKVVPVMEPRESIGILTPEQARKLLCVAPGRIVPHLAIALFCGPRRSELERSGPECVDFDAGLVKVNVTKTAGAARRFVRMRPNCAAWLRAYPLERLTAQQFRKSLEAAIEAAEIRSWPNNATRHSFCSYALAGERDINDLTLEMGHTKPGTLFAHYRELVTPAQAAEYWSINPFDRCH